MTYQQKTMHTKYINYLLSRQKMHAVSTKMSEKHSFYEGEVYVFITTPQILF